MTYGTFAEGSSSKMASNNMKKESEVLSTGVGDFEDGGKGDGVAGLFVLVGV
jgi:hypothetical protein